MTLGLQNMRKGKLYKHGKLIGEICETPTRSLVFSYDALWRARETEWVSLTLPYESCHSPVETRNIPSFFDGLIPEGWLLDIAYKLKPDLAKDRFGLLLAVAKDCVGSVSVVPEDPLASRIGMWAHQDGIFREIGNIIQIDRMDGVHRSLSSKRTQTMEL